MVTGEPVNVSEGHMGLCDMECWTKGPGAPWPCSTPQNTIFLDCQNIQRDAIKNTLIVMFC